MFYIAKNEDIIVGFGETREELLKTLTLKKYTTIIETETKYIDCGGFYLTEEEIKQKEIERIGNLTATKRVFALILNELGVDYLTQLKPLIESNPTAQLEWELCSELQRKNPLIDIMAEKMGISSTKVDKIFRYANNEIAAEELKEGE